MKTQNYYVYNIRKKVCHKSKQKYNTGKYEIKIIENTNIEGGKTKHTTKQIYINMGGKPKIKHKIKIIR